MHGADGNTEARRDVFTALAFELEEHEHGALVLVERVESLLHALEALLGVRLLGGIRLVRGQGRRVTELELVLRAAVTATMGGRDAHGDFREPSGGLRAIWHEPSPAMRYHEHLLHQIVHFCPAKTQTP